MHIRHKKNGGRNALCSRVKLRPPLCFLLKEDRVFWCYRKWAVKLCGKGGGREPGRCAGSGGGRREAARVRKSPLTVERKNKKRRGIYPTPHKEVFNAENGVTQQNGLHRFLTFGNCQRSFPACYDIRYLRCLFIKIPFVYGALYQSGGIIAIMRGNTVIKFCKSEYNLVKPILFSEWHIARYFHSGECRQDY